MYALEVKIYDIASRGWRYEKIKPTHGSYYQFETLSEAKKIMNICYPHLTYGKDVRIVRIIKEDLHEPIR